MQLTSWENGRPKSQHSIFIHPSPSFCFYSYAFLAPFPKNEFMTDQDVNSNKSELINGRKLKVKRLLRENLISSVSENFFTASVDSILAADRT